ncbi:MAG: YpdA family putative bacillithiol disulfide reductase [Bacteroidota bacterium]
MTENDFDIIIIGAGPIGLACGIEAKKNNLSYLILEKGSLVNSIYNYPKNMTFFSTSDRLEIGEVPFISHGVKPTRTEALEYYTRVASSWKLNINLYEGAEKVEKGNKYSVQTNKGSYAAKSIIVSTGFYDIPYMMNVPGENLEKVRHYYDEPYPYFKQKIAVVGAANSAVDVALETYRKGADVTMIIREPELSNSVKYWVKPDIENRIKESSIKAYFNSEITKITEDSIEVSTPEGALILENDFVLAMTGYKINYGLLKDIGIEIQNDENKTPRYNEGTNETNQADVYLAGVVCGGLKTNKWFIENSRIHAKTIIDNILKKHKTEV